MRPRLLLTINRKSHIVDRIGFFARGLHTCTAVARLPLRQLGFLVYSGEEDVRVHDGLPVSSCQTPRETNNVTRIDRIISSKTPLVTNRLSRRRGTNYEGLSGSFAKMLTTFYT